MKLRMKRWSGALGLVLLGVAGMARAETVDFSVGDDSFRLAVAGPLSRLLDGANGQYDIGGTYRSDDEDVLAVHTGVMLTGDAGFRDVNVVAGLGVRAVYFGYDDDHGGAVALGGQVEARFPGYERIGFFAYGHIAPEVTSFGELDRYHEFGVGVDYQLLRNASVYVGYRQVQADIGVHDDVEADDSVHAGIRLNF